MVKELLLAFVNSTSGECVNAAHMRCRRRGGARHFCMLFLLGMLLGCSVVQAQVVALVISDKSEALQSAADALVAELVDKGVSQSDIRLINAHLRDAVAQPLDSARVVVTLGTPALRAVLAQTGRTPVIATLLPKVGYERVLEESGKRTGSQSSAIYLDQPLGRQLDLLRLALPKSRRLGAVWGQESASQQPALLAAAQARDFELVSGLVKPSAALGEVLRSVLTEADALIVVPDPQVFNGNTVPNVLITSYRARVPVIAVSPSYVRAGALLSVYSTPAQLGVQAAAAVQTLLQTGVLPSSQYPQNFEVAVNDLVARSLGLSLQASTLRERLKSLEKRP